MGLIISIMNKMMKEMKEKQAVVERQRQMDRLQRKMDRLQRELEMERIMEEIKKKIRKNRLEREWIMEEITEKESERKRLERQRIMEGLTKGSLTSEKDCWKLDIILFEDLKFGEVLGQGTFGVVKEAMYFGIKVAAKQIHKNYLENEFIEVPWHPHIVHIYGCTRDETDRAKYWIVMEKMETDLHKLMSRKETFRFSKQEAIDAMLQIARAMKHLHKNNILHRDVKPSNVLVSMVSYRTKDYDPLSHDMLVHLAGPKYRSKEKYLLKLADFGAAKINFDSNDPGKHTLQAGTPAYMAPEMSGRGADSGEYTRAVDVYSFGMTCRDILSCTQGKPVFLLVNSCCNREPKFRPCFDKICKDLEREKMICKQEKQRTQEKHETTDGENLGESTRFTTFSGSQWYMIPLGLALLALSMLIMWLNGSSSS